MPAPRPSRAAGAAPRRRPNRSRRSRRLGSCAPLLFLAAWQWTCSDPGRGPATTVGAAASLRAVLPELVESFAESGGREIRMTFAASGDLRRQVEAGAPIDLVILAAAEPVDALIDQGLALAESRRVIAYNRLVLVAPPGSAPLRFRSLGRLPTDSRLAIGDPRTVPAGWYARRALQTLGSWDQLESRLILGGHVAAVLAYARRGEVEAAIVYETDIRGVNDLEVLDRADPSWSPVPQVVAALTPSAGRTARELLAHLASPAGSSLLRAHGFVVGGTGGDD